PFLPRGRAAEDAWRGGGMSGPDKKSAAPVLDQLRNLVRQWDGKLTRELLLEPGGFGLGRVPHQKIPDRTTTMVCGVCSTGCGLNIHLRSGEAIGLTPSAEYPVNLG